MAAEEQLEKKAESFRFPPTEEFQSALTYKPLPDDLFLVTYPKCGTTWSRYILTLIYNFGEPSTSSLKSFTESPFIDLIGAKGAEEMPRPGSILTHLPFKMVPWSEQAKYIYCARNPKDCCISAFYHAKSMFRHVFDGSFDSFFELFITGDVQYDDYFDHLLGWYEHKNDPNVLFITYEELKVDTKATILKMASFIDDKKYAEPLRNDPEKLNDILHYSSLEYMKASVNKAMEDMVAMSKEDVMNMDDIPNYAKDMICKIIDISLSGKGAKPKGDTFVRKGVNGDWRNHMSAEQSRRMDEKFAERTEGTELPDLWKDYM